jgi:hypothetical protein
VRSASQPLRPAQRRERQVKGNDPPDTLFSSVTPKFTVTDPSAHPPTDSDIRDQTTRRSAVKTSVGRNKSDSLGPVVMASPGGDSVEHSTHDRAGVEGSDTVATAHRPRKERPHQEFEHEPVVGVLR